MANYPQELAQDAVCQSHTGHMTGLWFLPTWPLRLNTNKWMNEWMFLLTPENDLGNVNIFYSIPSYSTSTLFFKLKTRLCINSKLLWYYYHALQRKTVCMLAVMWYQNNALMTNISVLYLKMLHITPSTLISGSKWVSSVYHEVWQSLRTNMQNLK